MNRPIVPENKPIVLAGLIGIIVSTGLIAMGSGFNNSSVGRLVVMAVLVVLAAKGRRWAGWLIAIWFITLGIVVAIGLSQGTSVSGVTIGIVLMLMLIGSGVQILRFTNRGKVRNSDSSPEIL